MRGLPSILSLFRNEFNKFNNTRARMLNSICHMTLRLLWKFLFCLKKRYNFVIFDATLLWTSWRFLKIRKPLVVYQFYCMALFHSHIIWLNYLNKKALKYIFNQFMQIQFLKKGGKHTSKASYVWFWEFIAGRLTYLNKHLPNFLFLYISKFL